MRRLVILLVLFLIVLVSGCTDNNVGLNNETEVREEMIDITNDINDIQKELSEIDSKLTQSSNS